MEQQYNGLSKKNFPIDENVFFILNLIESYGHEARIVGGAVRNFLLNAEISDIDIATTARPEEIINICKLHQLQYVPIGIKYGSVLVIYKSSSFEFTTLREDVETFGRDAKVVFSKSFEKDSTRRDFTINAIYMNKNGEIFDYHSGIEDIRLKNLKYLKILK